MPQMMNSEGVKNFLKSFICGAALTSKKILKKNLPFLGDLRENKSNPKTFFSQA